MPAFHLERGTFPGRFVLESGRDEFGCSKKLIIAEPALVGSSRDLHRDEPVLAAVIAYDSTDHSARGLHPASGAHDEHHVGRIGIGHGGSPIDEANRSDESALQS
jgi:hypothetical protein